MKTRSFSGGWSVKREPSIGWYLVAPDGYIRYVGQNWRESVSVINLILDNHGSKYRVS